MVLLTCIWWQWPPIHWYWTGPRYLQYVMVSFSIVSQDSLNILLTFTYKSVLWWKIKESRAPYSFMHIISCQVTCCLDFPSLMFFLSRYGQWLVFRFPHIYRQLLLQLDLLGVCVKDPQAVQGHMWKKIASHTIIWSNLSPIQWNFERKIIELFTGNNSLFCFVGPMYTPQRIKHDWVLDNLVVSDFNLIDISAWTFVNEIWHMFFKLFPWILTSKWCFRSIAVAWYCGESLTGRFLSLYQQDLSKPNLTPLDALPKKWK